MSDKEKTEALLESLQQELKALHANPLFRAYNSLYRLIGFHFLKGIAFGLGSVLGATIVVSVLLYFLAQIEFIPIIGDWVKLIISEIQPAQ